MEYILLWLQKQNKMIPFHFHDLMLKVLARHLDTVEIKTAGASFYIFVATL